MDHRPKGENCIYTQPLEKKRHRGKHLYNVRQKCF